MVAVVVSQIKKNKAAAAAVTSETGEIDEMTHTMAATPTASPRGRQRRVKCSRTSRLFLCYCAIIGFVLFMGNGIMLPGCQASTSYRHGHTPTPGNIVTTDSKVAQKQYIVCLSTAAKTL